MGQDYRLKKLYEQLLKGEVSSVKTANTLSDVYKKTKQHANIPADISEKLKLVSGIEDNEALQSLYNCYIQLKQTPSFKTDASISIGSPESRAFDPKAFLNFNTLKNIIGDTQFDNKPFIVTYAGKARKIRTPIGTRVGKWEKLTDEDVHRLIQALHLKSNWAKLPAVKPLIILALYEELSEDRIKFVTKLPPGIKAEEIQAKEFNKLSGLPPVQLWLPSENSNEWTNSGITFNGARKIKNVGKADIALFRKEESSEKEIDVFWVSFKEGSYASTDDSKKAPGFQQWGSLKTIYSQETSMKNLIDLFLTKCVKQATNFFDLYDKEKYTSEQIIKALEDKNAKLPAKNRTNITKGVIRDIKEAKRVHIVRQSSVMYAELLKTTKKFEAPKEATSMLEACFKSIYGLDFQYGKETQTFGPENVNIILETPQPATLDIIKDEDGEPISARLTISSSGHVLKNPDMPDSDKYLPCLYLRRTANERFLFKNIETGQTELILCGRALIYTIGRAIKEGKMSIDLFK